MSTSGGSTSGSSLGIYVEVGVNANDLTERATAPLLLTATDVMEVPSGWVTIPLASIAADLPPSGQVVTRPRLVRPAFTAPVDSDVFVSMFLTNASGTSTIFVDSQAVATFPAGAVAAGHTDVNFSMITTSITGVDLSVSGTAIATATGGITYTGYLRMGIGPD